MITNYQRNTAEIHFENVDQWLAYASNDHGQKFGTGRSYKRAMYNPYDFNDNLTGEIVRAAIDSRQYLNTAFTQAYNALPDFNVELPTDYQQQEQPYFDYDEMGFYCDLNMYNAGEDYCMLSPADIEQTKPVIWLACSIGGLAEVDTDRFFNRGLAFIKAVEQLQQRGVSVGVVAYSACCSYDGMVKDNHGKRQTPDNHIQTIVVKRPEDDYSAPVMANVLASGGTFRTVGFAVRCLHGGTSHGATQSAEPWHFAKSYASDQHILIYGTSGYLSEFASVEQAVQNIISQSLTMLANDNQQAA